MKRNFERGGDNTDLIKCLNSDFANMSDEDLDELLVRVKEVKERRAKSRKIDAWRKVQRAIQDYIMDVGMIELFTKDSNFMLDADAFRIPGEINLLD